MDKSDFNREMRKALEADEQRKAEEKKQKEVILHVCRALAQAIKEICKVNDVCEACPWYEMCGTEPYSWKIPGEDT